MAALKLYFGPGSCAFAALVALEEAGAEYEAVPVRLADGAQRRPEFLALNPRGQVPVIEADGQTIRENIAVLSYIASRFPAARLLPFDDPFELARVYEFLSWFATNLHVAVAQIWRAERFSDDEAVKASLRSHGVSLFEHALRTFDAWTYQASGPWLFGEQFSVADSLALVTRRWAGRLGIDLAPYPGFSALVSRLEARPAIIRAMARESVEA